MTTLNNRKTTATLLLLALSAGVAIGPARGVARAAEAPAPALSPDEFDALRGELRVKSRPWATIPWKVSVTEARELAAKTHKPVFLVVNTGNCLGFV